MARCIAVGGQSSVINCQEFEGENLMLWTIIVILLILWLLGFLGGNISPNFPKTGNWIHVLIVIVVILVILQLLGIM
jgi:hypothetical protein